jgi:hypothetical protein
MPMLRHALSGTEYHYNGQRTVRVVGKDGVEGIFKRNGEWISGSRRTADPGLCKWIADSELPRVMRATRPISSK